MFESDYARYKTENELLGKANDCRRKERAIVTKVWEYFEFDESLFGFSDEDAMNDFVSMAPIAELIYHHYEEGSVDVIMDEVTRMVRADKDHMLYNHWREKTIEVL